MAQATAPILDSTNRLAELLFEATCDDGWTDLDRDSESGLSPEPLYCQRHVTNAVCQSDQGVGVVCATSFSQRHLPIGTMALRAIVREPHLS